MNGLLAILLVVAAIVLLTRGFGIASLVLFLIALVLAVEVSRRG